MLLQIHHPISHLEESHEYNKTYLEDRQYHHRLGRRPARGVRIRICLQQRLWLTEQCQLGTPLPLKIGQPHLVVPTILGTSQWQATWSPLAMQRLQLRLQLDLGEEGQHRLRCHNALEATENRALNNLLRLSKVALFLTWPGESPT